MNSNEIVKHNFEREKNELKSLADIVVNEVRLSRVKEEAGPFGLCDHDVSGKEMNRFANEVQTLFIDSNKTLSSIYSCLSKVYSTFEFLDSEYLKSIIASMKTGEKNTEEVKNAQKDIKRIIKGLNITVDELEKFKSSAIEKLKLIESINIEKIKQWELYQDHVQEWFESCKYFWNVDETYNDVLELKKKVVPIPALKTDVNSLKNVLNNEKEKNKKLGAELDSVKFELSSFVEECSNIIANIKQDVIKIGAFNEKLIESINIEKIKQWELYQDHVQEWFESCKYFWNVDETYNDVLELKKKVVPIPALKTDVNSLKNVLNNEKEKNKKLGTELDSVKFELSSFVEECSNIIANIKQDVIKIGAFNEKLQKQNHLSDVDELWRLHHILSERLDLALNDQVAMIESREKKIKHQLYLLYGIVVIAIVTSVCNFFI